MHNNKQIQEDIDKLAIVVLTKQEKNQILNKEN